MRLNVVMLVVLFVAVFFEHSKAQLVTTSKRFLSAEDDSTTRAGDSIPNTDEEREIGAATVFGTVVKAMRAKAKLTILLGQGASPAKAMTKLKIKSLKDKNFNSFARYYASYLAKYPDKAAKLPATAEDAAMAVKMKEWIKQKIFPQQAAQQMLAFGQKDIAKYVPQYMNMWTKNQAYLASKVKIKHVK